MAPQISGRPVTRVSKKAMRSRSSLVRVQGLDFLAVQACVRRGTLKRSFRGRWWEVLVCVVEGRGKAVLEAVVFMAAREEFGSGEGEAGYVPGGREAQQP